MEVSKEKVQFKDSKIGKIPSHWELVKLKEMCSKVMVGIASAATHAYRNEGVPLLRNQNIREGGLDVSSLLYIDADYEKKHINKRLKEGDVLTVRTGYPGISCVVPKKFEGSQCFTSLISRPNKNMLDSKWLSYFINSPVGKRLILGIEAGGAQKNLNAGSLENLLIPNIPLDYQQKIVNILSTWDQAIDKTQKLIDKLELRKKGLIQKLLTEEIRLLGFDGDWKKYEIGEIAVQFTDKNSDNRITEVLSCTKYDGLVRSLEYFGRIVYGKDLKKYKVVPRNYFAYATNHIEEGSIGYQNLMDAGLVSPMYTVFKTNFKVDDSYLFRLLKTDRMIYHYQSNMSGSVARRGGLRWNTFKELIVSLPPLEEQKAIATFLEEADNEISLQNKKLESLKSQKKGLMQQLLTGKTRVKI